jgi:hypothetical protein
LTLWRKTNTRNHQALIHSQPATGNQRVTAGALEGQRAVLHNGVFQVRSQLTPDDPIDPIGNICRTKAYDVELIGGRLYVLEGDGLQFDPLVRLERFGQQLGRDGAPGRRNAQLFFQPFQTDVYRVYVSSVRPANGPFTLTVRENNRPKPFVP